MVSQTAQSACGTLLRLLVLPVSGIGMETSANAEILLRCVKFWFRSSEPSQSEIFDEAFRHNEDLIWLAPLPPTTVYQGNEARSLSTFLTDAGVWCYAETEDGQHHELQQLDR